MPIHAEDGGSGTWTNLPRVRQAALDRAPVAGLTHKFYRYPARFSPRFAAAVIEAFSRPGELVLDPYMGGGTTIVEAWIRGRHAVGCDLNSLAVFVARAKTTTLSNTDSAALRSWADEVVPRLSYWQTPSDLPDFVCQQRTKNLSLPEVRPIKKILALALRSLGSLPQNSVPIARCALLNTGQWALNGRAYQPTLKEFRARLRATVHEMIDATTTLSMSVGPEPVMPVLIHDSASHLNLHKPFDNGMRAQLVVTSPPYPGIHMLYHRWQVDGRRESPAPYWLAECQDGHGSSFYNFASRHGDSADKYFAESLRTLTTIRKVVKKGAVFVQLIAFADPKRHLPRYLKNMGDAGFAEVRDGQRRLWRRVPGRKWHATLKGTLPSSREVVLIHEAV